MSDYNKLSDLDKLDELNESHDKKPQKLDTTNYVNNYVAPDNFISNYILPLYRIIIFVWLFIWSTVGYESYLGQRRYHSTDFWTRIIKRFIPTNFSFKEIMVLFIILGLLYLFFIVFHRSIYYFDLKKFYLLLAINISFALSFLYKAKSLNNFRIGTLIIATTALLLLFYKNKEIFRTNIIV